jgi:hypothetical protein
VLKQVGGNAVSPKTIQRIEHVIGNELAKRRDAEENEGVELLARPPEAPPELAVVECDGGLSPSNRPAFHYQTAT